MNCVCSQIVAQAFQLGFGLEQGQGREHDLFAMLGEALGDRQPVLVADLVALRADGLAEIDDIDRCFGHHGVEGIHLLLRPIIGDRPEREAWPVAALCSGGWV